MLQNLPGLRPGPADVYPSLDEHPRRSEPPAEAQSNFHHALKYKMAFGAFSRISRGENGGALGPQIMMFMLCTVGLKKRAPKSVRLSGKAKMYGQWVGSTL